MMRLKKCSGLWPQWLATFLVCIIMLQCGISGGWSSPYMVILTSENSTLPLSLEEASWVSSLLNVGRIPGSFIGGFVTQDLGSKMGLLMGAVPFVISWTVIAVATDATWLYAGRIFGGLGMGMLFSAFPLYIGEIADPSIRGCLISIAVFGASAGNMIVSGAGVLTDFQISGLVFLVLSLVFIVSYTFLPESPHHLARKNSPKKTKASLRWYDRKCDVEVSYTAIKKFVDSSESLTFRNRMAVFKRPEMRRALFIVLTLFMYQQLCGLNTIIFYMEMILTAAEVRFIPPSTIVIIEGGVAMIACILSMYLIDVLGRKSLMIMTSAGVTMSFSVLAIHFNLLANGYDTTKLQAIPILSLTIFQLCAFGGLLTVPSTILSETLPPSIKCIAACIGNAVGALSAFVCSKTFQILLDALEHKGVYWIYAGIMLSAIPFIVFFVPETKGKSLQQIQDEITSSKH